MERHSEKRNDDVLVLNERPFEVRDLQGKSEIKFKITQESI